MDITNNLDNISLEKNPSKADLDDKKLADDFDDFLLLLTTELKHQDPTEPMDSHEFTSQLVQFSSVEQQIGTNKNMEQLLAMFQSRGMDTGVSYLDQVVEARGNAGFLVGGTAPFIYNLSEPASNVDVVIQDAQGRTVYTGNGPGATGRNLVTWDGVGNFGNFAGREMPDGDYYILATGKNVAGDSVEVETYTSGRVTAVENSGGETLLSVGNITVPLEEIQAVRSIPEGA